MFLFKKPGNTDPKEDDKEKPKAWTENRAPSVTVQYTVWLLLKHLHAHYEGTLSEARWRRFITGLAVSHPGGQCSWNLLNHDLV